MKDRKKLQAYQQGGEDGRCTARYAIGEEGVGEDYWVKEMLLTRGDCLPQDPKRSLSWAKDEEEGQDQKPVSRGINGG